jgi:hypothetical protein
VELHERACHGEAQSESALPSIEASLALDEEIEHTRHEIGRHADPGVAAFNDHVAVLFAHAQQNVCGAFGILRGVREQVGQHLRDPDSIGFYLESSRNVQLEPVLLLGKDGRRHFHGAGNGVGNLEALPAQLDRAPAEA